MIMDPTLAEPTPQTLEDYMHWHCEMGRGHYKLRLCPRGLSMWRKGDEVSIGIPHFGHTHNDEQQTIFIRAVF